MHPQRNPTLPEADDGLDHAVLTLLLDDAPLWSDDEVAREVGDPVATADALGRLSRAGLVHRHDGFAFATRAARQAARLARA